MKVGKIYSAVIYERDSFEQTFGPGADIYHKPYKYRWFFPRGKPIGAWAKIKVSKDSPVRFFVVSASHSCAEDEFSTKAVAEWLESKAIGKLKRHYMID